METTEKIEEKKLVKKPAESAKKPRTPRKKTAEIAAGDIADATTNPNGRYTFATGRRKTAVATVRLFSGNGDILVNKKPFDKYFFHKLLRDTALQPLELTGLTKDYYFVATINGGGINAQSEALRQAISKALIAINVEHRTVLKKNGLLTRDDRKKERKKPGLRRARRAPQWAKR